MKRDLTYEKFNKIMSAYKLVNEKIDILCKMGFNPSDLFDECHKLHEELLNCYFNEQEIDIIFEEFLDGDLTIEELYDLLINEKYNKKSDNQEVQEIIDYFGVDFLRSLISNDVIRGRFYDTL